MDFAKPQPGTRQFIRYPLRAKVSYSSKIKLCLNTLNLLRAWIFLNVLDGPVVSDRLAGVEVNDHQLVEHHARANWFARDLVQQVKEW